VPRLSKLQMTKPWSVDRGRFKPGQNCQVVAIEPEQKKRNPFRTGTLSPTARVTQIKHVVGTPPVPQAKILFVECQNETGYPAAVVAIVTEPEMLARIVLLTRPRFHVDLPPILPESQISVSLLATRRGAREKCKFLFCFAVHNLYWP